MSTIASSMSTCVIGDIHGCHDALIRLLRQVHGKADTLVFLGDYGDRGPDTKKVVDTLLSLRNSLPLVITLMGNHDLLFLQYLAGRRDALFLQAGGLQTLNSYGLTPDSRPEDIARLVPPEHISFFSTLPLWWEDQNAIYVHAGLQPGCHLSQQTQHWCLWVKETDCNRRYAFGKPVVFGHTVFREPLLQEDRIGIDTGAVYGGHLTALLLPGKEFIRVPGRLGAF